MNNSSRRLAGILCASVFLGVVGLLVTASVSAPTGDCVGCGLEKIRIHLTGDPDFDRASWKVAMDAAKEVQRRTVEKAVARHRAKFEEWHGTRLSVKRELTDADTIALHESICAIFSSTDPPAPPSRAAQFKAYLDPESTTRCVGFYGYVESITPNQNGKMVVISVSPKLESKMSVVAFTNATSIEAWQIDSDGSLRHLKSQPHPKRKDAFFGD